MNFAVTATSETGVTINNDVRVSWKVLRAAAKQEDEVLQASYQRILAEAEKREAARLTAEEYRRIGFPLSTGFDQKYRGQIVMRAWEIRSKGKDRVAYVICWDRSTNTTEIELTSPEFPNIKAAHVWVLANYGAWHDELGASTASAWLHA